MPICSIEELEKGLNVKVCDKKNSATREGVVTKINRTKKCMMIDGRPSLSSRVVEAVVTFADGVKCEITPDNFKRYKINRLL